MKKKIVTYCLALSLSFSSFLMPAWAEKYSDEEIQSSETVEVLPDSEQEATEHKHVYTADFQWSADGQSVRLVLTCINGDDEEEIFLTDIEQEVEEATCSRTGMVHNHACYEYQGIVYQDQKDILIPTLPHDPGDLIIENVIPATTDRPGSYEEVRYCTICGAEVERIKRTEGVHVLDIPVLKSLICEEEGLTLTWGAVEGAEKYRIFRKIPGESWSYWIDTEGTSLQDLLVNSGVTYTYTVRCINKEGTKYTSDYDHSGLTETYYKVPYLNGIAVRANGVLISWDTAEGVGAYRIYRRTNNGGWEKVKNTVSTAYLDTNVTSGNIYQYTVRGISSDGRTFLGSMDQYGKAVEYVSQPVISSVTNAKNGVSLTWVKPNGGERYRIFRKTDSSKWSRIGDSYDGTFVDTTALSGKTYSYTVRAMNYAGTVYTSAYDTTGKSITYVKTPKITSITNAANGVKISWDACAGAGLYRVYRKNSNGGWSVAANTAGTTWTDTTAVSGVQYTYTVRCMNSQRNAFVSAYDTAGKSIVFLKTPSVTLKKIAAGITVSWNTAPGASSYVIYRRTANTSWNIISEVARLSFADTRLTKGETYYYTVRACSGTNRSSFISSNPLEY